MDRNITVFMGQTKILLLLCGGLNIKLNIRVTERWASFPRFVAIALTHWLYWVYLIAAAIKIMWDFPLILLTLVSCPLKHRSHNQWLPLTSCCRYVLAKLFYPVYLSNGGSNKGIYACETENLILSFCVLLEIKVIAIRLSSLLLHLYTLWLSNRRMLGWDPIGWVTFSSTTHAAGNRYNRDWIRKFPLTVFVSSKPEINISLSLEMLNSQVF